MLSYKALCVADCVDGFWVDNVWIAPGVDEWRGKCTIFLPRLRNFWKDVRKKTTISIFCGRVALVGISHRNSMGIPGRHGLLDVSLVSPSTRRIGRW